MTSISDENVEEKNLETTEVKLYDHIHFLPFYIMTFTKDCA